MRRRGIEYEAAETQHEHGLDYLAEGFTQKTRCIKCSLFIPERQGCYACTRCSYAAHKACADLPPKIYGHPLHEPNLHRGDHLSLRRSPPWRDECYYCREAVRGGSDDPYYICIFCMNNDGTFFLMHAHCAHIPLPEKETRYRAAGDERCMYACHGRRMVPTVAGRGYEGGDLVPESACFSCESQWSGPAYRCAAAPICRNFFHKACADEPQQTIWDSRHVGHDLELAISRPESCVACGRRGCRHVYYCESRTISHSEEDERCQSFVLGVECDLRGTRIRCLTSHEHGLVLVDDRPCAFSCSACRKSHGDAAAEVHRTRAVSFHCKSCVFDLHFQCGPLPSVVKFDYHLHPLLLVDSLVEEGSEEYYCDVCEEERDLRFRVYYCSPCKYTAHVHCLLSEIVKLIKEGSTADVEFLMLGESRWDGKEENPSTSSSVTSKDQGSFLFSRIVVGRLTRLEKEKIKHTYHLDSSSKDKIISNQHKTWLVSFLDGNKESEIEDVDRTEEFFHLDSTKFAKLCPKLSYSKLEKPFGLDNKYTRMKAVDVGGYKVPLALALDLKTLLHKHGNLDFKNSSLTPQMKSFLVTLLCAIFNKMRNTMAEDMSIEDLRNWYFTLNGVKKIAGSCKNITELACFEESVITTFLGFEAMRFRKDAGESLELKMVKLEAELEKCKEEREKLKRCASSKSDFMKECLRKASESKWKTADNLI